MLVDIICDSDGKVEKFIDLCDVKVILLLYEFGDWFYYFGVFLMGVYQDVFGSVYNFFGKVSEVYVMVWFGGCFNIDFFVCGQKVWCMIELMGYEELMLCDVIEDQVDVVIGCGMLMQEQEYELFEDYGEELFGYIYLEYES